MSCEYTVLFQYDGMIRAIGLLIDLGKEEHTDERGVKYAGFYRFDVEALNNLDNPIDKETLKTVYLLSNDFGQSKQLIDLSYLDDILALIESTNSVILDDNQTLIT